MSRRLAGAFAVAAMLSSAVAASALEPSADSPVDVDSALVVAPNGSDSAPGTVAQPLATTAAALQRARAGQTILLRGGTYPVLRDQRVRTGTPVVVRSYPGERATVAGIGIYGGQGLAISRLTVTGSVTIAGHPTLGVGQRPAHIEISDSDISTALPGAPRVTHCVMIRHGASNIVVRRNHIHDCTTGIAGVVRDPRSRGITIADNEMENFTPDAIQFGSWEQVSITGNVIHRMTDGGVGMHTDGIQLTGDVDQLRIAGNRLSDSENGQLVFFEPAYGPISNVVIENNLITRAEAIAVQIGGVINARVVHNTIWGNGLGDVIVRPSHAIMPTGIVVVNNAIGRLDWYQGPVPAIQRNNYVTRLTGTATIGNTIGTAPGFGDDWRPGSTSPLLAKADPAYSVAKDVTGAPRAARPSIGAFEPAAASPSRTPAPGAVTPTPTVGTPTDLSDAPDSDDGDVDASSPAEVVDTTTGSGASAPGVAPLGLTARIRARRLLVRCVEACVLTWKTPAVTIKRTVPARRDYEIRLSGRRVTVSAASRARPERTARVVAQRRGTRWTVRLQ